MNLSKTNHAPIRRLARLSGKAALAIAISSVGHHGLSAQSDQIHREQTPQGPDSTVQPTLDGRGYTLHVTTREVVVEVVARDHKNHPVNDFNQGEFELFEDMRKAKGSPKRISGFRVIDPAIEADRSGDRQRSVVLPLGGRCEIRSTVHYELAFHPTNWTNGYHSILLTTTRRHIKLSYRAQYYVGVSDIATSPAHSEAGEGNPDLMNAACYHSRVPASLLLNANRMEPRKSSELRYSITILPGSLELAGLEEGSTHVQLEFGVCTFSRSGRVIGYWHFSEDRSVSPTDIGAVLADGWRASMEVPRQGSPALARFVVLEPKSGNLGTIDLSTTALIFFDDSESRRKEDNAQTLAVAGELNSVRGGMNSLGSPIPRPEAICGDVYELPTTTGLLPSDFRVLNAIGDVYTDSLNVSERVLSQGIPGSTRRSDWFGIDYYGEFWTTTAGKYLFVLNADDGADLYIDDHMVIDDDGIHPPRTVSGSIPLEAGRHTIHLPYFQGPTYVNLSLQVKPPGEELRVFDVRDFSKPSRHLDSTP
jgi:hypothetical protein